MAVIGLTGGILSGKSTVSAMLADRGAAIIDADKIGHETYRPNTKVWKELVDVFGEWILKKTGEVNRERLAEIVFNDPAALTLLNKIVHPSMHKTICKEIARLKREGIQFIVLEAAILIEAKWTDLVDEIWVTVAPEEAVIDRLQNRMGLSEEQARARIRSQLPTEEKMKHADVVIDTNCPLPELGVRIAELWRDLQERA